jgi:hypothetical protein
MIDELNKSEFTLTASGVWICFEKKPTLDDIRDARRLLNQLTDELIKERLCSPEN